MRATSTNYESITLLGLRIDILSQREFLYEVEKLILQKGAPTYVVTPNSEFFTNAQKDKHFKKAVNSSAISITDGVFIQWATTFNKLPVTAPTSFTRKLQIIWQYIYTGAAIVINPGYIRKIVPERLQGSQLIHDLSQLADKHNCKIAFAGGYSLKEKGTKQGSKDTLSQVSHIKDPTSGKIAAEVLKSQYPKLEIVSDIPLNKDREFPADTVEILKSSGADVLFFCGMPRQQEKWLHDNIKETGIRLGFGLGGSLDYVSGLKKLPPKWMSALGIEWFLRPFLAEGFSKRALGRLKRAWVYGFMNTSLLALKTKIREHTQN